jgi:integrase
MGLLTAAQAAARLSCSVKTLYGHVRAGELRYVVIGKGTKRPRCMFTDPDLNAFIEAQTRKDSPCPSSRTSGHRIGASTSRSEVIAFTARPNARTGGREKAKVTIAQQQAARASLRLDDVFGRYWNEIGQFHAGARNTERQLDYLVDVLGKNTLITDVTTDDVSRLIARRRGDRGRDGGLVSPITVNDTLKRLKAVFSYCKDRNVRFDHEPKWRKLFLPEPEERKRELVDDEAERLAAAAPDDVAPFFAFAAATGLRFSECFLKWSEVDWNAGQIRKPGKGNRFVVTPITTYVRAILWPLRGHHPEFVFTRIAQRARGARRKGERYPLNAPAANKAWFKLRAQAGVTGFRFHDFRHDVGTKVLRLTGNLKLTKDVLNHRNIRTTLRYAHVMDGEVSDALEHAAETRKKSPMPFREVG